MEDSPRYENQVASPAPNVSDDVTSAPTVNGVEFVKRVKFGNGHVFVAEPIGDHILKAQRMAGKSQDNYFPALMHCLCYDRSGLQYPMDTFRKAPARDFTRLMTAISELLVDEDNQGE